MKGITFSLISGFLAATASLCGKFSMATEETLMLCENSLKAISYKNPNSDDAFSYTPICQNVIVFARIGFFVAMLLSNILMWTLFTKALRLCSTTLEATVTNTAANFFFTAIYGQTFFGESLTFLWWIGTLMILFGLLLMHRTYPEATAQFQEKKND